MNNPIDYTAEARRINELVSMEDRENAYAGLASRLREERDAAMDEVKIVKEESLRVIKYGEPVELYRNQHRDTFLLDGEIYCGHHGVGPVFFITQPGGLIPGAAVIQPVKLRYWNEGQLSESSQPSDSAIARVEDLLKKVEWQEPQVGQLPFDRGYNLAMTQVKQALNGSGGK